MTPDIVVDIGNTRVKWGLCGPAGVIATARLAADPQAWAGCLADWRYEHAARIPSRPLRWALAGVVPDLRDRFRAWVTERGDAALVIDSLRQLTLDVQADAPDRVGIDRLLNAVAARSRCPGSPVVLIDIGSAVTVDWLDGAGTFHGGTIFPGFRLMANALHEYTAQLPVVSMPDTVSDPPGGDTVAAMQTGIAWAVAGGVAAITRHYARQVSGKAVVFVTGGDGPLLSRLLEDWSRRDSSLPAPTVWPEQTLEGIRITAEAQP
jgi:type III pantothenate kinase